MSAATKYDWEQVRVEGMTTGITRQMVWMEHLMVARLELKKDSVVPAHSHDNEQGSYVVSGTLRFWLDEHADAPGEEYVDVHAGEVLMIPGGVRHRALALEDTVDLDIFTPPRQDWISATEDYLKPETK